MIRWGYLPLKALDEQEKFVDAKLKDAEDALDLIHEPLVAKAFDYYTEQRLPSAWIEGYSEGVKDAILTMINRGYRLDED